MGDDLADFDGQVHGTTWGIVFDRAYPIALRSRSLRAAVLALPVRSRIRREVKLRGIALGYLQFNRTGEFPKTAFAPDVVIEQTAAMLDTAGTFRGREGIDAAMAEISEGWDQRRFEPPNRD